MSSSTKVTIQRFQIGRMFIALLMLAGVRGAMAGVLVNDRGALQDLLAANAVTENFERFELGQAPQLDLGTELDSSTVIPGQGPGLVIEGIRFNGQGHVLGIDNLDYLGSSQVLVDRGTGERTLLIDFLSPVKGFAYCPITSPDRY